MLYLFAFAALVIFLGLAVVAELIFWAIVLLIGAIAGAISFALLPEHLVAWWAIAPLSFASGLLATTILVRASARLFGAEISLLPDSIDGFFRRDRRKLVQTPPSDPHERYMWANRIGEYSDKPKKG